MNREFLKAGHLPTLLSSFLYFDVSFMIWVMLGALGVSISHDLGLTPTQKGLLVASPILGGSLLRIPFGMLSDRIGAKKAGIVGMGVTFLPLLWGWFAANNLSTFTLLGLFLGAAGASFAVALPLASGWYPQKYQGRVMGIAGAGNSGTLISMLFAPRLASLYGWHEVFALYMIPLALTLTAFTIFAKDSNKKEARKLSEYTDLLKSKNIVLLSFLYSMTFGGFVGFSSYLSIFFHDQYHLSAVDAGTLTTLCIVAGSFSRPLGGYLADRMGGVKMLSGLLVFASAMVTALSRLPSLTTAAVLLFLLMMALGMGNGSVFQIVPSRFPNLIGLATGVVGAAGGLGGFLLPIVLGALKEFSSSYAPGLELFGLYGTIGLFLLNGKRVRMWVYARGGAIDRRVRPMTPSVSKPLEDSVSADREPDVDKHS
jgi:NNP family nitrate/nitrite transporter-like MFS transporter